jgi:hypothetical protein
MIFCFLVYEMRNLTKYVTQNTIHTLSKKSYVSTLTINTEDICMYDALTDFDIVVFQEHKQCLDLYTHSYFASPYQYTQTFHKRSDSEFMIRFIPTRHKKKVCLSIEINFEANNQAWSFSLGSEESPFGFTLDYYDDFSYKRDTIKMKEFFSCVLTGDIDPLKKFAHSNIPISEI